MALSLANTIFGPRAEAQTVSPAQRRADVAQPFPLREATPQQPVTRRTAPAVQVRLSKEALAFLGGDKSMLAGKDARAPAAGGQDAPAPAPANTAAPQAAAFQLDDFGPPPAPALAPYAAQGRAPDKILPPGSTLDITL